MIEADVAVVGGGPAGTSAAIELSRSGYRVVLVDKAVFPRDKCCGDGLTAGALRRLERLGFTPRSVPSWQPVDTVVVRSPSGRTVRFPLPDDGQFAAVVPRVELDHALVELAKDAGAEVHTGHAVTAASASGGVIRLGVDGIDGVSAPYVVAADGMWSPLRKALGVDQPGYLGEWHAFRQYVSGVGREARDLWVWFDPDLLPGYAWSFPLPDGRANVGFGIPRVPGRPTAVMGEQWRDVLDRPHVRAVLGADAVAEGTPKAWPIPASVGSAPLYAAGGRVLFVGDAARAADPMTGEGIGQALETASWAARAITVAGPSAPEVAARVYGESVRSGLRVDNRAAAALSRVLASPKLARGAVRIAGASDWTRRNFARWLFEDYPRAILATPRRWHAGMLHGKGAFRGEHP